MGRLPSGAGIGVLKMKRDVTLPEHEAGYFESPLIPFPSAKDAVEAIQETATGYMIDTETRVKFYAEILTAINALINQELRWYEDDPVLETCNICEA